MYVVLNISSHCLLYNLYSIFGTPKIHPVYRIGSVIRSNLVSGMNTTTANSCIILRIKLILLTGTDTECVHTMYTHMHTRTHTHSTSTTHKLTLIIRNHMAEWEFILLLHS